VKIDEILQRILGATADKARAEAVIARLREGLHAEAMRRFRDEGAAPSWKARGLGSARLDGADAPPKVFVSRDGEFADWLAQRQPESVVATLTVPADRLADALDALGFAGVDATAQVVTGPAALTWVDEHTRAVQLEEDRWSVVAVDEDGKRTDEGEIPGLLASRSAPRIVISLAPEVKAQAVSDALAELDVADADARVLDEIAEDLAVQS
jgi:hypothetical protein